MYKILLKEQAECLKLKNVIATNREWLNREIDLKKAAKKAKDAEALAQAKKNIVTYEGNILELERRLAEAARKYEEASLACGILRTKVYVADYVLEGAVFELREFLKKHAVEDEGEARFCEELTKCHDTLMKIVLEFGTYGEDNESFNVCEEITAKEIDAGIRAMYEHLLEGEKEKLKKKYKVKV